MPSPEFLTTLQALNQQLSDDIRGIPSRKILKELLTEQGYFTDLTSEPFNGSEWLKDGVVAACDGSRVEYGPFYPYSMILQRAMAIASNRQETITEIKCTTPLLAATSQEIEELVQQRSISVTEAYSRWLQRSLAALEVKVAAAAIERWQPRVLLMDGGLLLFDTLPGWPDLQNLAREAGTILIGVIEEIATAELAPRLDLPGVIYDRELLYGLLGRGEAFIIHTDKPIKREYRTAFTRLSSRPAAAACDFLPDTSDEEIISCLQLLYATTGKTGRGIPFLVDLVDRKVRISRQEGEILLKLGLNAATYEKYFSSQRASRNV